MSFSREKQRKIENMMTEGATYDQVVKTLGGTHHWMEIQEHCWKTGDMSWQGSKKMVSNRTRKLSRNASPEQQAMLHEIDQRVQYLYNCARAMQKKLRELNKTA